MKRIFPVLFMPLLFISCRESKLMEAIPKIEIEHKLEVKDRILSTIEDIGVYCICKLTGDDFDTIKSNAQYKVVDRWHVNSYVVGLEYKDALAYFIIQRNRASYEVDPRNIMARTQEKKFEYCDILPEVPDGDSAKYIYY